MLIKLSGWDREIFARRLIFLLGFIKFKLSRSKRQNEPFEKSRNWRLMVTLNTTSSRAALETAGFSLRWPRFPCTKRSWTRASKRDVWWSAYASLPIFVPFSALAKTLFWNQGRVSTMASIAALLSFKFGSMESGWTWLSTIDCPRLMASLCTWAQVRRDLITLKSKRSLLQLRKMSSGLLSLKKRTPSWMALTKLCEVARSLKLSVISREAFAKHTILETMDSKHLQCLKIFSKLLPRRSKGALLEARAWNLKAQESNRELKVDLSQDMLILFRMLSL